MSAARSDWYRGSSGPGAGFLVGFVGPAFAVAYLAGIALPLVHSDRDATLGLIALGWLGCMAGAGATVARAGWSHPIVLAGVGLGLAAAATIVLTLSGLGGPVLWLAQAAGVSLDRAGIVVLAAIIAAKSILAALAVGEARPATRA